MERRSSSGIGKKIVKDEEIIKRIKIYNENKFV